MNRELTLHREGSVYNDVVQAYRLLINHPAYNSVVSQTVFPTFDAVFEEYITRILDEKTKMASTEIELELEELKRKGVLLSDPDFLPEEYRVSKQLEMLAFLRAIRFTFLYEAEVVNAPFKEVW